MLPCIITDSSFSGSETVYVYKINLIFGMVECPRVSLLIIIVKTSLKRHVISVSTQLFIREINNIRVIIYPCYNNTSMVNGSKMSSVRINVSFRLVNYFEFEQALNIAGFSKFEFGSSTTCWCFPSSMILFFFILTFDLTFHLLIGLFLLFRCLSSHAKRL